MSGQNISGAFKRKVLNLAETGANLRKLREQRELTVSQMSDLLGVTNSAIYRWEEGAAMPALDQIKNICGLLETPFDQIFVFE